MVAKRNTPTHVHVDMNLLSPFRNNRGVKWPAFIQFILVLALLLLLPTRASANDDTPSAQAEVLAEGRRILAGIEDYTFTFDHPGFYWMCGALRSYPDIFGDDVCAEDATPWQYLLERPSDYRGRQVCIEGVILQVKDAFRIADRPELGTLYQIELGQSGSNAVATVVLTEKPPTASRKSHIRLPALFIKARRFRGTDGGEGAGPLLVGRSFEIVKASSVASSQVGNESGRITTTTLLMWLAGSTLIMAFVFAALRRGLGQRSDPSPLSVASTRRDDGVTGTAEDFEWLDKSDDN